MPTSETNDAQIYEKGLPGNSAAGYWPVGIYLVKNTPHLTIMEGHFLPDTTLFDIFGCLLAMENPLPGSFMPFEQPFI
jgi:hypothetical protein